MRFLLYFVTFLQLLGAVFLFSALEPIVSRTGFQALPDANKAFIAAFTIIHLLGLVGAILVWTQKLMGFRLSIAHQILIAPVVQITNTFGFATQDPFGIFILLGNAGNTFRIQFQVTIGQSRIADFLLANSGTSFIGINLFAVFCALYLRSAMRKARSRNESSQGASA